MRRLVLAILLASALVPSIPLPASTLPHPSKQMLPAFPDWLAARVFEAACAQSFHFEDLGPAQLMTLYYAGQACIEYLGRDTANEELGVYRAKIEGGSVMVSILDTL